MASSTASVSATSSGTTSASHTSSKGSLRVRHVRPSLVSLGNGPSCQLRADLSLIPATAAAVTCVDPSDIFFLSNLTCSSVTIWAPQDRRVARTRGSRSSHGDAVRTAPDRQE